MSDEPAVGATPPSARLTLEYIHPHSLALITYHVGFRLCASLQNIFAAATCLG
jgi:hypothetical protein